MPGLKEYTVDIGGLEHTLLLTEAEAKARGATEKKAAAPPNKARTQVKNKG